ncbi:MAG TPA: hypothetical protein VF066_10935, partial [Thermoleophilaceae bacterium]
MKALLACAAAIAAVLLIASGSGAAPAAIQRVEVPNGSSKLRSTLAHPAGNQRFPAVVLLGECRRDRHVSHWLLQLQARGFAALSVGCRSSRTSLR